MTPYPKYPYVKGMALEDYFAGLDRYESEQRPDDDYAVAVVEEV